MPSLTSEFKDKYLNLLGPIEAQRFFAAIAAPSKKAFRLNSLKAQIPVSYAVNTPVPVIPQAYYGQISGQDPEWVSGRVYSQDPAAMFPAYAAQVHPGERVLDLCAAPGGKTTALAEALQGSGLLVANEISPSRVKVLRENLERWGVSNSLITNMDPASLAAHFLNFFDCIVVDAPCSGEGMFRKNPDAINYWSPDYVTSCAKRQREILKSALTMLKPSGRLIYATCTFSPEEDEGIVAWLLSHYSLTLQPVTGLGDLSVRYGQPQWAGGDPALEACLRFWPQDDVGEGQFLAVLQSVAPESLTATKQRTHKKRIPRDQETLTRQEQALVAAVMQSFKLPAALSDYQQLLRVRKQHVFLPVLPAEQMKGFKVINNGVEFGLLKKNRFEPGHQLAMVLGQEAQTNQVTLINAADYQHYLHGETVKVNTTLRGFVLVSYQGAIFSFGKVSPTGVVKNFYPKGLRQ